MTQVVCECLGFFLISESFETKITEANISTVLSMACVYGDKTEQMLFWCQPQ